MDEGERSFSAIVAALEHSPLLIGILDLDGKYVDIRGAWSELLGLTREDVIGRRPVDLCHPDDRARLTQTVSLAYEHGTERRAEFRFLHKDGSIRWIEWCGAGAPLEGRLVGIGMDRTAERLAQRAERQAHERLEALLATVPDYITWVDREGVITYINRTYPGVTTGQVVGTRLSNWLAPGDRAAYEASIARICAGGPSETLVVLGSGESGPTWYESRLGPLVESGAVVGVVIAGRDVTEDRRARLKDEERSRLETVGLLAAGIAHEFNNIMTLVLMSAEAAREAPQIDPDFTQHLDEILAAVDRSKSVTGHLLALSRGKPSLAASTELRAALHDAQALIRATLGVGIAVLVEVDEELHVNLGWGPLQQILINLATNARRALRRGGRVILRARPGSVEDPILRSGRPPAAVLSFEDNGAGMPPEVQGRAFEPFFTSGSHGGTGLGLAMVYGMVQAAGGEVTLESHEGRGTTFTIYLAGPVGSVAAKRAPPPHPSAGNETVLVVDDEHVIRSLSARYLSRLGYVVLEASSVADALSVARAHPGRIDLLVTDLNMVDGSGFELEGSLAREYAGLSCIFITGYVASEDEPRAGSGTVLRKPFAMNKLAQVVRSELDARRARARK